METKRRGSSKKPRHEERDVNVRALAYFGLTILAVLVLSLISMKWVFFHFAKSQELGPPPTPFESVRALPPQPRLQFEPQIDLGNYRESQKEILSSYGWVDRQNGVVRIPIDRAMSLLLERGFPVRPSNAQSAAGLPGQLEFRESTSSAERVADSSAEK